MICRDWYCDAATGSADSTTIIIKIIIATTNSINNNNNFNIQCSEEVSHYIDKMLEEVDEQQASQLRAAEREISKKEAALKYEFLLSRLFFRCKFDLLPILGREKHAKVN